jgi:hypothetical protein
MDDIKVWASVVSISGAFVAGSLKLLGLGREIGKAQARMAELAEEVSEMKASCTVADGRLKAHVDDTMNRRLSDVVAPMVETLKQLQAFHQASMEQVHKLEVRVTERLGNISAEIASIKGGAK